MPSLGVKKNSRIFLTMCGILGAEPQMLSVDDLAYLLPFYVGQHVHDDL